MISPALCVGAGASGAVKAYIFDMLVNFIQWFLRETDAEHALDLKEITELLEGCGVTAERKTLYTDFEELRRYMEDLTLSGGSATDFRPVFEHVDRLIKEGSFSNLRGLLYFTDGMGIYPTKRPDYEVAFILLEEPPLSVKMPPWAIRIMPELPWRKPRESFDEFWQEEILQELPEL